MKRVITFLLLIFLSVACFAQSNGTFKFLGIPIDGSEEQFGAKLKSKGFQYSSFRDCYLGQFNGSDVELYLHTNHNVVDRVFVAFPETDEEDIWIEYNRLLRQFNDNPKYTGFLNDEIPYDEDISHEMKVNKKRYEASFCYFDPERDVPDFVFALLDKMKRHFTDEEYGKIVEECKTVFEKSSAEQEVILSQLKAEFLNHCDDGTISQDKQLEFILNFIDAAESIADGNVWFMIDELHGKYQILLYYDNLHNMAHGEDL